MFERFTERARQVIVLSQEEARGLKHNYIGTEHLLLGLLREEDGVAARVLGSFDITVEGVRAQVVATVGEGDEETSGQIPFTPRAKKVLELSLRQSLALGQNYIGTEHVLLGLVSEDGGVAARMLRESGAHPERIRDAVVKRLERPGPPARPSVSYSGQPPRPSNVRWEYRVERFATDDQAALQAELGKLGGEGWSLAAVVPGGEGPEWIFQRRASGERTQPLQTRRDRSIGELVKALAEARQAAHGTGDEERVAAITDAESRFATLVKRILTAENGAPWPDLDVGSLDEAELLMALEDRGATAGDLVDVVCRAKEAAIENQQFERAAESRDRERRLRKLLGEMTDLIEGGRPSTEG